jgi:D-alanyl-D-alanine carboxypeptidase
MFERFETRSRAVVVRAHEEASALASTKVEAEHLLLALSREKGVGAGSVLANAGLDHDGLVRALDAELARSLEAVGVASSTLALAERPLPTTGQPRFGASAKHALVQALSVAKARGDRSIRPAHILLGVLHAREGTVPRALAQAGVDPAALAASAQDSLDRKA